MTAKEIEDRILTQICYHGPNCPTRASIHPAEYEALKEAAQEKYLRSWQYVGHWEWHFLRKMVLIIQGPHGVAVRLSPAEDIPEGSIRWEPRE